MEDRRDIPEQRCSLITENEHVQERFIQVAVKLLGNSRVLPPYLINAHVALQVVRAATSTTANYAEARTAQSCAAVIHKLRLALKELRKTDVWPRIIARQTATLR